MSLSKFLYLSTLRAIVIAAGWTYLGLIVSAWGVAIADWYWGLVPLSMFALPSYDQIKKCS